MTPKQKLVLKAKDSLVRLHGHKILAWSKITWEAAVRGELKKLTERWF